MRLDEIFDGSFVEIADGHDGHEIRPVPVFVEPLQRIRLEILDDFRFSDRKAVGISRTLEDDRKQFIRCARACWSSSSRTDPAVTASRSSARFSGFLFTRT